MKKYCIFQLEPIQLRKEVELSPNISPHVAGPRQPLVDRHVLQLIQAYFGGVKSLVLKNGPLKDEY